MSATALAIVCTGGALGALLRFWITRLAAQALPTADFPLPTLFINLTGSALLGVLFGATDPDLTSLIEAPLLLFFGVGFCGAYTTFSSFCTETVTLIGRIRYLAIIYVLLTIIGSIAAFSAAFTLLH